MITRSPAGQPWHDRARSTFLVVVVLVALGLPLGLATGDSVATAAEDTVDLSSQEQLPAATVVPLDEPQPSETPPPPETTPTPPTSTPTLVPPAPFPTEEPLADPPEPTLGPEPTPPVVTDPDGTDETRSATPPDVVVDGSRHPSADPPVEVGPVTTASTATCDLAPGSSDTFAQGGVGLYTCVLQVVSDPVLATFAWIDLDWTISADVSDGWTVDLGLQPSGDQTDEQDWTSEIGPTLGGVDRLTLADDEDEDPTDRVFRHSVLFGLRLTAPRCGGPVEPDVSINSVVGSKIDGEPGTESYNSSVHPVRPVLAITVPVATVDRSTVGVPVDPSNPLRFSHAEQVADAGRLEITVTDAMCGGWSVSMSATDFVGSSDGGAFRSENLVVTNVVAGQAAPAPAAGSLRLTNESQMLVTAPDSPLPSDTYTYALDLELTIPGGTPPGDYTSTVTITTSAAP